MKLTKRQIKKAARLIAGSMIFDFNGNDDPEEFGCSQEEWEEICLEGRKIAEHLLDGFPAFGGARLVIDMFRHNNANERD